MMGITTFKKVGGARIDNFYACFPCDELSLDAASHHDPVQGSAHSKARRFTLIGFASMIAVFGWFLCRPTLRSAGAPNILVTYLGQTNDTAGKRFSNFSVKNQSDSTVRLYRPFVESDPSSPTGRIFDVSGGRSFLQLTLESGASSNFSIPSPLNQPRWKLSLLAYPNWGRGREIKTLLWAIAVRIGIKLDYRSGPYNVYSDWIEDKG
jgi:hypothetical protein